MRPIISVVLAILAGCGQDDMMQRRWDEALVMPTGIPASDLPEPSSPGAQALARYCSQCHGIPSPGLHSAEDWVPTVRRMVRRMGWSSGMMRGMGRGRMHGMPRGMVGASVPSRDEQRAILGYLQRHALVPLAADDADALATPGGQAFAETCSQCHALPSPAQHTPDEWPGVVARMRGNMQASDVADISDARADEIVAFLTEAAGSGQ